MWTLLFLTVSLFSSFQCSPLVYSGKRVSSESTTYKELQRYVDLGIKVTSSSVRTDNPSGISSTVIKHDSSKTSPSLKNYAANEEHYTEKILPKKVTDLNTKHKDFNDSKIFTYDRVTIDSQIVGHLKNTSHPEKNDDTIKSFDENSIFIKHTAESKSSVTTEEVDLSYRKGSNSDNEANNTHKVGVDDNRHDRDKVTTKRKGRVAKAKSSRTHLNGTSFVNKTIDPRTTLPELSEQRHAEKNVNMLKMLEEKKVLNVTSLTSSNVKNSTAKYKVLKATSKLPSKGKLVTVTEEVNLRYREGSDSYNITTHSHNESADDKRHGHDEETTKQVERTTKSNNNETHLNKTRFTNQTTDSRTTVTVIEFSRPRHTDNSMNPLKIVEEKEVLNVNSTPRNIKNSTTAEHEFSKNTSLLPLKGELETVTQEINLRYGEGSNNKTTNTHNESEDDKRHDHDKEATKQVEESTKANDDETHLNKTRSSNQTTDTRAILKGQSEQRHADKNVNTLKMLKEKEDPNVSSTGSNVKNSIVTEETNSSYREGSNSNNITTNNHNESTGDKTHHHDEEITKQVGVAVKANSNETHLNKTKSANQTINPKTILIEQSKEMLIKVST